MNETTITMKMACIPGIPNVNNVVYSKECFLKAFQNYMETKDSIPVTINPDYSTLPKIQFVDLSKGRVLSFLQRVVQQLMLML